MQAKIMVKVNLDNEMVQEIMEDAGYDEFTQEQAQVELKKINIGGLVNECPDITNTTIEITE